MEKFLSQTTFTSQEDFVKHFHVKVPENFNFGYDVVDAWAAEAPNKIALCWTNDHGVHHDFTFAELKDYTDRTKYSPFGKSLYKRFDAGLKIGCGIAFQNFYFSMGYDIGLFDIAGKHYAEYQFDNFDGRIRTGNFTMTLGVDF